MTFYVEKKLALGSISFGAAAGQPSNDDGDALSTGPTGEFIRSGNERFFFGGHDAFAQPALPAAKSISSTPFWSSLRPDGTPRGYGLIASMALGVLFALLGLAVVGRKGPQGWVEVILGVIMIAVPIVMTAQKRKKIREQEERERAEREALEKRNREALAAYTAALDRVRQTPDDESLAALAREREALAVPNEIWSGAARRTVLLIAFDTLQKRGPAGASEIARLIDRVTSAAGLSDDDAKAIKTDIYRTVVWHFLAANRLGQSSMRQAEALRKGLGVSEDEAKAVDQFQRVRTLTALPRVRCTTQLQFGEYCIYETPTDAGTLHVTNKRTLLDSGKKKIDIPRATDVIVNADEGSITLKTDPKKPLRLKVAEPIYAASVIDAASQIDERPRGFA
jgi:heme exporter protein D